MEFVLTLMSWQVFFGLTHCQQQPALKLPTLDELKQMRKEAYRRFKQAIKAMAHHRKGG
ncbi:hypothetical protein ES705_12488 [subsurface metagenome]